MDEFYKKDNIELLKQWVYLQIKKNQQIKLIHIDSHSYIFTYKDKKASFLIWPNGIIEEIIEKDNKNVFYLHYQFYNFSYAIDLFHRMMNHLLIEEEIIKKKILLCCSGGMTTGYFASRANQFCQLNQLPYKLDANSVDKIISIYQDYELILLAPQVHYRLREIEEKIKDKKIVLIDTTTFASYDCAKLLHLIKKSLAI